jgi:hypothetical protein
MDVWMDDWMIGRWHDDNQRLLCLSFSCMTCMAVHVSQYVPMVAYALCTYTVRVSSSAAHRSRQPDSDRGYVPGGSS